MDRREQDAVVGETAVVETSHIPRRSTATFGIAHPSRSRLKKVDRRTRKNGENRVFWETNMLTECQSVSQSLPHSCKRRRGRQRSNIEGTPFSRLRRPIRLEPFHGITARSALCDTLKVASAGTSVRASLCSLAGNQDPSRFSPLSALTRSLYFSLYSKPARQAFPRVQLKPYTQVAQV
jgi:hypothetical protein